MEQSSKEGASVLVLFLYEYTNIMHETEFMTGRMDMITTGLFFMMESWMVRFFILCSERRYP